MPVDRLKYLDFVQAAVTRMAANTFLLKGWTDYERDIWRANVVRNCWVTREREEAGFFDGSLWEEAQRKGRDAIERMIDRGLENTSVTVVLIGAETSLRDYVGYEITQSHVRGNGMIGIYIHGIKDTAGRTDDPSDIALTLQSSNGTWVALRHERVMPNDDGSITLLLVKT